MQYFKIFDLPVSFQVDQAQLKKAFLANTRKYHPDFYTLSDEIEQAQMLDQSSTNNIAYKILSDSDKRIHYILDQKGFIAPEGTPVPLPPDFLMEMMEINEQLMELEFDPNEAALNDLKNTVQNIDTELLNSVKTELETWHEGIENEAVMLDKIKYFYFKRKYLLRIRENLSTFASA